MSEESLFHEALAKASGERAAFLDQACRGQSELRIAVEALLAAHGAAGSFLEKSPDATGNYVPSDVANVPESTTSDYQTSFGPGRQVNKNPEKNC